MRGWWKALVSDSFVQIAVILSLLRTDLTIYLRQYSGYPELQHVLLGQSVGLNIVDNYHNNGLLPLPASKYVNERDSIFNELHRLIQPPQLTRHHPETSIISAWLVSNDTAHSSTSIDHAAAAPPEISQIELSRQDVELIESLWKADLEQVEYKGQDGHASEYFIDEDTGDRIAVPGSFSIESLNTTTIDDEGLQLPELPLRPTYNAQSSLELALEDLGTYRQDDLMDSEEGTITNSSMLYPDRLPSTEVDMWSNDTDVNTSGILWGSLDPLELVRQESSTSLGAAANELLPEPSLLDAADLMDIGDFGLDTDEALAELYDDTAESVSEDSALGFSPEHSWSDGTSMGSERHSISSDPFELDDGAVGYSNCKTEPYDKELFDLPHESHEHSKKSALHDHTYGAPPGGVPHVRKMDIKRPKVPSRGLAHDQAMCKKLKIPFSVETIINSPVDEFNSLLELYKLNSKQTALVKDIRRRGKNKVAAQNCRQKKVGEFSELEEEVMELRKRRSDLYEKKTVLRNKSTEVRKHIDIMSAEIFRTLRDENGIPYDMSRVSLEVGRNGEIEVTSTERTRSRSRNSRKRDSSKRRRR